MSTVAELRTTLVTLEQVSERVYADCKSGRFSKFQCDALQGSIKDVAVLTRDWMNEIWESDSKNQKQGVK